LQIELKDKLPIDLRTEPGQPRIIAVRAKVACGPLPVKAQVALKVAGPLLAGPVADRTNWTLARLAQEIERREGVTISRSQFSKVLRKKGLPLPAAPAHAEGPANRGCDPSRRTAFGIAQAQARAGDIVLLFADESEALTHPYLARGANVCKRFLDHLCVWA